MPLPTATRPTPSAVDVPIPATVWPGGRLLCFSGLDGATDFRHGLVMTAAFDGAGFELKLPAKGRLTFAAEVASASLDGDHWRIVLSDGRSVVGGFVDATHILLRGPVVVTSLPPEIRAASAGNALLIGCTAHFRHAHLCEDIGDIVAARQAWQAQLSGTLPAPLGLRGQTFQRALSQMKGQVCTPEGAITRRWTTPDRWPHRGMWLWDTAFHAIGWRHLDPALSREMILAMLSAQHDDGFLPHFVTPYESSTITQPPVLALAVSLVQETAPDRQWLALVYPKLCAYIQWDLAHRDLDGDGLAEWFIESSPTCRSGESGMDNSNRFDTAKALGATDFNAYLALECELLSGFAEQLGMPADAVAWRNRATDLRQRINKQLYSADAGFYLDADVAAGQHSHILASAGFMPLICGAADRDQLQALLRHLDDPRTFGTPVPLPSVALNTEGFGTDMWRGPMWVCVNWLVAYGLDRYGETGRATRLRQETMAEIERWFGEYGIFYEYYDALGVTPPPELMRKGQRPPRNSPDPFPHQAIHDFGWTATLYVDMLLSGGAALYVDMLLSGGAAPLA